MATATKRTHTSENNMTEQEYLTLIQNKKAGEVMTPAEDKFILDYAAQKLKDTMSGYVDVLQRLQQR